MLGSVFNGAAKVTLRFIIFQVADVIFISPFQMSFYYVCLYIDSLLLVLSAFSLFILRMRF